MFVVRIVNYICSLPTLFFGIKNFPTIVVRLINRNSIKPIILNMRDGAKLRVYSAMDVWTAKEVYLDKDYERHSIKMQDGWTVIDIGAAFGDFDVLVGKQYSKSKIYAFEPNPEYFFLIQENIRLNKLRNVKAFQEAVGAEKGMISLGMGSKEAVRFSTATLHAKTSTNKIQVSVRSLEQIFKEEKIMKCDYLKMDCEGGEYDIFFNTPEYILKRIKFICMEFHNHVTKFNGKDLADFFQRSGFEVQLHSNPYRHEIGFLFAKNKTF